MKVSVCMATFNGEKFIKQQIDSILCQLNNDDELIISDDGSTDNTLNIISSYKDKRIKLLLHERNMKLFNKPLSAFLIVANNFENALKFVSGDYIFLSDQDDIWCCNKISTFLLSLDVYDLVICNYSIIDENNKIIKEKYLDEKNISFSIIKNIIKNNYLGCCMAFRRYILKYILPFPKYLVGHDWWIGVLISYFGDCFFINTPLHLYRRHNLNVSASTMKSNNSLFIKISYRIFFFVNVLKRIFYTRSYKK
jgi:glycosyltransferase involved in cell wall biosynthesis